MIVALVSDLMDQSRIRAALSDVRFVREAAAVAGADVVVVDLARFGDRIAGVRAAAPSARIVAFGPHVDDAGLAAAADAGADTVVPRSQFFRDPAAAVNAR